MRLQSLSLYFGKCNFEKKRKIPELIEYELEEERRVKELDYLIYMISAHAEK